MMKWRGIQSLKCWKWDWREFNKAADGDPKDPKEKYFEGDSDAISLDRLFVELNG